MEAGSFTAGVRQERYSEQQDKAPKKNRNAII
jgi:hypothetical protein